MAQHDERNSTRSITAYKALLFDVYGTLMNWETGIHDALQPLLAGTPLATDKAATIRTFDATERELQQRFPTLRYSALLAKVHEALSQRLRGGEGPGSSDAEHIAFGQSIARWPVFPDTVPALAYLSTRYKLFVLSNVDHASFAATQRALEGPPEAQRFAFTAVYTAEDAGAYKPAPGALAYALKQMKEEHGLEKSDILVVAQSLHHDIAPAKEVGIAGAWIARWAQ
ncbi:haloalkanoic acid dehalogenase [Amylocystis lapponica]|nr:haloalkanoic acid dehalogenase [Amylocystis lapponica]